MDTARSMYRVLGAYSRSKMSITCYDNIQCSVNILLHLSRYISILNFSLDIIVLMLLKVASQVS